MLNSDLNSLFFVRAIGVAGVGTKNARICSWHFLSWQPLSFSSKSYISEHKLIWTLERNNPSIEDWLHLEIAQKG